MSAEDKKEEKEKKSLARKKFGKEKSSSEPLKKPSGSWLSLSSIRRSLLVSLGTSSLGKGTIIANLPYETQNLIRAIVTLTGVVHSMEAANAIEDNIFRLLCELFSAHASKEISYKDFLVADPCLREAFEVLMKLFHYYDNNPRKINLMPGFKRVEELFTIAADLMTAVLEERLNWEPESLGRLKLILDQAGNAKFLATAWADEGLSEPLFDLYDAMQKYNAFHYYSKSTGKRSEPSPELKEKLDALLERSNSLIRRKTSVSVTPTTKTNTENKEQ